MLSFGGTCLFVCMHVMIAVSVNVAMLLGPYRVQDV